MERTELKYKMLFSYFAKWNVIYSKKRAANVKDVVKHLSQKYETHSKMSRL